jgi:hypothetical protein
MTELGRAASLPRTMITSQVENEEACSSDQLGWDHAIKSMVFGAKARSVCCGQDGLERSHCPKKGWHQP